MRPKNARKNWNVDRWEFELDKIPAGLTLSQAAKRLKMGYVYTCIKLRQHNYKIKETRGGFHGKRKLTPAKIKRINWKLSDAALGRKYGVSRERMRQVRNAVGKPRNA